MSRHFPCKSINCTKFGAVVWQDMGAINIKDGETGTVYDLPDSERLIMLAAFLNFDDAVNYAIAEQERADAACKADGYTNKGKVWAERTSGNSLVKHD